MTVRAVRDYLQPVRATNTDPFTVTIPDWTDDALCTQTDPDAFYPERGEANHAREAKAVCRSCEVRTECLEYALAHHAGAWGIWGGTSERERRVLRKEREAS